MADDRSGAVEPRSPRGFVFGGCTLDLRRGALLRDGEEVRLRPKSFAVLLYLVERHGQLVTKDELLQAVWGEAFVTEGSLTQCIIDVRRALGTEVAPALRTIPRRGFRFEGPVALQPEVAVHPAPTGPDCGDAGPAVLPAEAAGTSEHSSMDQLAGRVALNGAPSPPTTDTQSARESSRLLWPIMAALLVLMGVLSSVARWNAAGQDIGETRPPAHPIRFSFDSGLQIDAAWAPDGQRIAYAADVHGNFDVFIQSLDGSEPVRLTASSAHETQPSWSPDGRRLVFRSSDGGGLFTVNATGGPVRRIADVGFRPMWMPDGRDVAFADADHGFWKIFLVSADGGATPREVLEGQLAGGSWGSFAVHADGRLGLWGVDPDGRFGFHVSDPDRRVLRAVNIGTAWPRSWQRALLGSAYWNKAGDAVLVHSSGDGTPAIWRVPIDPATQAWRTPVRLATGPAGAVRSAISPDGTRVAFTSIQSATRAWVFPFDADRGTAPGEGRAVTDEDATIGSLYLSSDGSRLYYSEARTGRATTRGLRTDLDTGETTVLVDDVHSILVPSRRASGTAYMLQRLAESPASDPEYALAWREANGQERLLAPWASAIVLPTDLRPDDSAVLGTLMQQPYAGTGQLVEWPVERSPVTPPVRVLLQANDRSFWQGRYSPTGRWVSFVAVSLDESGLEIGLAPADSRDANTWTRVAADHARPDKPRWSPDGGTLYFLSQPASGFFELWGVRIDQNKAAAGPSFRVAVFDSPRWHVDPDLKACEMGIGPGRLVLPMRTVAGSIWLLPTGHTAPAP